jgi:acetylornithine/N-succinyldiaminopimelate aminotransferase
LRKLASPELQANVHKQSQALRGMLDSLNRELGVFAGVRGRGLMLGAVLAEPYKGRAGEILDHAAGHGLLVLQAGPDVLRFVPPLNISDEDLAEGVKRLEAALHSFLGK